MSALRDTTITADGLKSSSNNRTEEAKSPEPLVDAKENGESEGNALGAQKPVAPQSQNILDPPSVDDIGWYGRAFMVKACCFQLLWGKVSIFNPPKYVFLALFTLFGLLLTASIVTEVFTRNTATI
ncbi:hypothetical protein BBP40_002900 [Aspergillus hancockii]|nr:hypothetical protein BBP40_002900 [Aspergillus hancockii]